MKIMKSTQLCLLICIFLIISITPVSASLQTELNPTIKTNKRNSLNDSYNKNSNTTKNNNFSRTNSNHKSSMSEMLNNESKELYNQTNEIVNETKHVNHTVFKNTQGKIVGNLITIYDLKDLKVGDILWYYTTVKSFKYPVLIYILITSITATEYKYKVAVSNNSFKETTEAKETFESNFNVSQGIYIFRPDPSIINTDEELNILKSYGFTYNEIETKGLFPDYGEWAKIKDMIYIMSSVLTLFGVMSLVIGKGRFDYWYNRLCACCRPVATMDSLSARMSSFKNLQLQTDERTSLIGSQVRTEAMQYHKNQLEYDRDKLRLEGGALRGGLESLQRQPGSSKQSVANQILINEYQMRLRTNEMLLELNEQRIREVKL